MAKHTQTIRRQIADELFECVWPFVKLTLKLLNTMLEPYFYSAYDKVKTITNVSNMEEVGLNF